MYMYAYMHMGVGAHRGLMQFKQYVYIQITHIWMHTFTWVHVPTEESQAIIASLQTCVLYENTKYSS